MKFPLQLSMVALGLLMSATLAVASEPHDAGFKARGLKDAPRARTYSSAPAPTVVRRSYSYEPGASAQAVETTASPAPIARSAPSYRSYSYSSVAPTVIYRGHHRHSGLSGDYASKATLYK